MAPQETPVLIIGAGPAGLAAAHRLGPCARVLEAQSEAGGLCRSFAVGKQIFDYGGHAFFTKDAEVLALIEDIAPQPFYRQSRSAWVWSHGRMLPYPFQANLAYLPEAVVEDCLVGLCALGDGTPSASSLDEWLLTSFGRGIYDHFLKPYNEKVWAFPIDQIVPLWVGDRIVKPDERAIVRGAISKREFSDFPNAVVAYPGQGGFASFFAPLHASIRDRVELETSVIEINLEACRLRTSDGREHVFDRLISTIPLPTLVSVTLDLPPEIREAAHALRHNSLLLVSMVVEGANDEGRQRIYSADPNTPFHKLVINSNSSDSLRSVGQLGVQAEISYSAWKPLAFDDVIERTLEAMREMGLLNAQSQVVETDMRHVEFGYPIYEKGSIAAARSICDYFERNRVLSVGRFGEWAYINSDMAMRRGLVAAQTALDPHMSIPRLHSLSPGRS